MDGIAIIVVSTAITLTSYQPIRSQTDDSPHYTSIGTRVSDTGIAVSRDLLCPMALNKDLRIKRHSSKVCRIKRIHYGDSLYVQGFGFKVVNDCMNKRHRNRVDVFVWTHKEEKQIGTRSNVKVWRLYEEAQGSVSY